MKRELMERHLRTAARLRGPVTRVVQRCGELASRRQARVRPADIRRKAVGDFVTAVDLQCERRLRSDLRALLPEAGFLGEESPPTGLDNDLLWVVDPIDGTSNFARKLPQYAVSAALLLRGQPLLGVVFCQPEGATYAALHRGGVLRGRARLKPPRARFDDSAIVGCQWFRGEADMAFLQALQARGARIRTFGSTVVQLCDAAMGRLDANVQQQGRVWDFAAAGLIAQEAGLRFTDWSGRAVFPIKSLEVEHTATAAARPAVHRKVLQALRPFA